MSIFTSAVEKPITTLMIFIGIVVTGIFALVQLPIDQYPQMDPPYLSVMTTYSGANAADIEVNITKPLENQLNSVENLKKLTSVSYDNLSVITLEFEWNSNLDEAANDVRDAIDKSLNYLPDDVDRPSLFKFNTSMMPIIMYAVTANESYPGLDRIIDDKIVNRLNRIDGVASVNFAGGPKRVVYVDLDPNKLDAYDLTVEQIGNAIRMENNDLPAGNLKMGLMDYQLRVEGEFDESGEINDIVVANRNGKPIFVKDLAAVRDTIRDISLEQLIDRKEGGVIFITKQSGANSVEIAKQVKEDMKDIIKDLPTDIHVQLLNDSSDFIIRSINNLSDSLFYALIFVILVVLVFLGRWRATFIIGITIPISLIVAFIYLYFTGESLNVISLSSLSIAIGMVVDDAIVVLENITKHIERGSAPREAAKYGTNEVWLSVIVTTLVTIAVFFPLTLVSGMTGILFKQLGYIICITVSTSTLTAITLTPMLSSQLLRLKDATEQRSKGRWSYDNLVLRRLDMLDNWYGRVINWSLRHKLFVCGMSVVIFVVSLFLARFIHSDFMPQNDQGQMSVYIKMQTGQRVEETKRIGLQIDSMMRANYPEMRLINLSYGSEDENAGFSSLFNKTGSNILNIRVKLSDLEDRKRGVNEIADDLRERLKTIPDVLVYSVSTSNNSMSNNSLDVEIMGYNFEETNKLAAEMKRRLMEVKGAEDVLISRNDDKPEMQLFLDRVKLAEHGLTTSQVANALRNRVYGNRPSKFKEDGEEYDIIVRIEEQYRNNLSLLENTIIIDGKGEKVRLKELGKIKEFWSPPNIERQSKQRIVKVSVTPAKGVSLGDIAKEANKIIDEVRPDLPQDISIYIGGAYEDQQESFQSLTLLMLLALLLVYIVMASQFESFKMPIIIMMSIPFAFTGVVLALLLTNTTLSVVAALGAVMLIGIVTKNGIVLIDFINLLIEREQPLYEAIVNACRSRLRPVLMTALTTMLGMLPMALSVGEGSETWRPMGIAVIGGLVFSTIITMIIVPVVYASMSRNVNARNKKMHLSKVYRFMKDFNPDELKSLKKD